MSRIRRRGDPADVRWVNIRASGAAAGRRLLRWERIRQGTGVGRANEVRPTHIRQAVRADGRVTRPLAWLDREQRRRIAPLSLWDVGDQLRDAAELYRLLTGR